MGYMRTIRNDSLQFRKSKMAVIILTRIVADVTQMVADLICVNLRWICENLRFENNNIKLVSM